MRAAPEGVAMVKKNSATEHQNDIDNLTAAIREGSSFVAVLNDRIAEAENSGNKMIDVPIESLEIFARRIITPKTIAWMRVASLIESAQCDPAISANPGAMDFLQMMKTLSGEAWGHWELSRVLQPLIDQVNSAKASFAASQKHKKNDAPHDWVLSEWKNRTDQGQSKDSFGRQYAQLVNKRFGLTVTPGTISRDWLPKTKK